MPLKICEFPFRQGDLAFTIILPEKNCIEVVENQLSPLFLDRLIAQMKPVEVNAVLPKFSINDRFDLRKVLNGLGGEDLLDFKSRENGLCLLDAFYESTIKVNYKEVQATQKDTFVMTRENWGNDKNEKREHPCEDFNCENPFIFFVRNTKTKLVLLMGKLMVPDSS